MILPIHTDNMMFPHKRHNNLCYFTVYVSNIIPHLSPIQISFPATSTARDLYVAVARKLGQISQQLCSHPTIYQLNSNFMTSTLLWLEVQMKKDVEIDSYSYFFVIFASNHKFVGILPFQLQFETIIPETNHVNLQLVHKTDIDSWIPEIELKYRRHPHKFSIIRNNFNLVDNSLSLSIECKSIDYTVEEELTIKAMMYS